MHDGDSEACNDVRDEVIFEVVVEEPGRDGEISVEKLLPRLGTGFDVTCVQIVFPGL